MGQFSTLGIVSLRSNGAELLPGRRKVLAMLAFLIRRGGPVERTEVARLLWPQADEARAKHSLRQALSELKTVLGDGLEVGTTHVRVAGGAVQFDVAAFEQEIAADRWEEAAARWRGDFLAGHEDIAGEAWTAWLAAERRRLTGLRERAPRDTLAPAAAATPRGRAQTSPRWTSPARVEHPRSVPAPAPAPPPARPAPVAPRDPMADPPPAAKEIAFGQLGTLSTDARAVLEAASVLGTRAPTAPLTRITGLSAAGFASAVMELERRGMLRLSPRQDALDFPGETARHQVYRLVAPDRRRTLHAAAARALAALPAGPADLETTAEHERLAIVPRPHHANRRLMLAISLVVLAAAVLTYLLT